MSNKLFSTLRKRMTLQYSLIFGIIILVIVFATYALTWWSLLAIEKQELQDKAIHEAEEWLNSKENPVNEKELSTGDMLAYFVDSTGKKVIIDQLTQHEAGKALFHKRSEWPTVNGKTTKMFRTHTKDGKHYRYLIAVCEVKDKQELIGYLYMFENMDVYYLAGTRTLHTLAILFISLFSLACLGSYFLAGRNLAPISIAYDKQKQFTADASHEMRTPLAVMKLAVQGIANDEDSKHSSFTLETLSMLEQEVDRLSRLTENLMTLARSDNHALTPQFTQIDFSELASQVHSQLQIIAAQKNIHIKEQLATDVIITGEKPSLNRLLIILLDNAIKYSPEGTEISFTLTKQKHQVQISVADQGVGISAQDKERIFERFYRVDKARSRSMGGLGLGLSLAKAIVELHQGKIVIDDNKPKGTIFTVQLPYKQ